MRGIFTACLLANTLCLKHFTMHVEQFVMQDCSDTFFSRIFFMEHMCFLTNINAVLTEKWKGHCLTQTKKSCVESESFSVIYDLIL